MTCLTLLGKWKSRAKYYFLDITWFCWDGEKKQKHRLLHDEYFYNNLGGQLLNNWCDGWWLAGIVAWVTTVYFPVSTLDCTYKHQLAIHSSISTLIHYGAYQLGWGDSYRALSSCLSRLGINALGLIVMRKCGACGGLCLTTIITSFTKTKKILFGNLTTLTSHTYRAKGSMVCPTMVSTIVI